MHLYTLPLWFTLVGLALYTVLGGADFGAGIWQLTAGEGDEADALRDHAHEAMGPVWEANHVWLIFILTVVWTAYPAAFGSIASTLSIPLFIAGIGIVLRGGAYALRAGTITATERRRIDTVVAVSSILTPFALGAAVGGIASARVHVGNPGGSVTSSWLNPTSIAVGVLAVASAAYMAAVFLSADAQRRHEPELAERFRLRALVAGIVAGAIALAALAVLRADAHPLFHRLTHGAGLPALALSVIGGAATLTLVRQRRYEPARYSAAVAVAATIAGWALAQQPRLLQGLTIKQAAAGHDVQVAVVAAVLGGAIVLFPSLALLFRLTLQGRLDETSPVEETSAPAARASERSHSGRLAAAALLVGIALLTIAHAPWAHAVGAASLLTFAALGSRSIILAEAMTDSSGPHVERRARP